MAMKFREPNEVRWVGVRPAHKGTQIIKQDSVANGNVVIYTVPSGKTLYLCEATILTDSQVTGNIGLLLRNASDIAVRYICYVAAQANATIKADHNHFWPPMEIQAGFNFLLLSSAAGLTVYGSIFGWEE